MQVRTFDWTKLPKPEDDGAADHLCGKPLPSIALPSTVGDQVDLATLQGMTVVYGYPMTGGPGVEIPADWEMIPGAPGCTPQSCSFRDHFADLQSLGVDHLFGLSTQSSSFQHEAVERLHLNFPLLSDSGEEFTEALGLPTFTVGGVRLLKRLTFVANDGFISKVFYPVYPPDRAVHDVLDWLKREDRARYG